MAGVGGILVHLYVVVAVTLGAVWAEGKPDPVKVTSDPTGVAANSFTLAWDVPTMSGAEISDYLLVYIKVEDVDTSSFPWTAERLSTDSETHLVIRQTTTSYVIKNLDPSTYYQVLITASNKVGLSEETRFIFKTGSGEDSEAAEDCCHDDHTDDLDSGLGLLAEQRVVVTVRRSSVTLQCAIAAEPQFGNLTFTWKKDGIEIKSRSPKGRRHTYPNGTLHIRKVVHRTKGGVRTSDEGMYECYVSNSIGAALAQRIKIVIASLGKNFTWEPKDGRIAVGESFSLPCKIHASPQDLMIVWQKDGALLKVEENPRYLPTKGGLLIIDAQEEDSGIYQCQVTNQNFFPFVDDTNLSPPQWRISRPAFLLVSPKSAPQTARFLLAPQNVTEVLTGDSVDVPCVLSISHPGAITWTRTGTSSDTTLPVLTSDNFTVLPGGSLRIHRASRNLAGMYTCSHNTLGLAASTRLKILEEPVILDSSPSGVYPLARIVRLDCLVAGKPSPRIRWLKNGQEVTAIRYRIEFLKEALVIYQGKVEDSGYYQCLVENKVGWALSLTRISVIKRPDAPSPPFNVRGEAVSSSRVVVQWDMEPSSGHLLKFTIHKRLAHDEGGEEAEIVDSHYRQAVLYGLMPDTLYAITVRAYNTQGASPSSKPIFIRTDLTGYPSVTLSFVSNSSVSLNWSDFHTRHRRKDDIASYQLYYSLSSSQEVSKILVNSSLANFLLTDLEENREYRVRMKATFKGENPNVHDESWPWSYIRTGNSTVPDADVHLAAPYNLQAFPLKPDAISLSWDYSGKGLWEGLPVTHYTVRCETLESLVLGRSCQGAAAGSVVVKTSRSNILTLDNLKAFTLYNISVSAHSDNIQGPYSRPILVQTKEDVPSQPENLEAVVVSKGQVRLQWQPPTWPNGLIQGHYIQYINHQYNNYEEINIISRHSNRLSNATWVQLYQKGNTTRATISNLTQRLYFFQVMACTNAGKGAPSTLVFVHMGEGSSKSGLNDQHLGILGGSVIGLTSIIITVVVIVCKQRQLQRQLENRIKLEQGRQPLSRPRDLQSPTSLTSQLSPSPAQSEELEQLLDPQAPPTAAALCPAPLSITHSTPPFCPAPLPLAPPTDNDSRDSGCSSTPSQVEDEDASKDVDDASCCLREGKALCGATQTEVDTHIGLRPGAENIDEHKETVC